MTVHTKWQRLSYLLFLIGALVALFLVGFILPFLPAADLSRTGVHQAHWYSLVNVTTNAFHRWRQDPILSALSDLMEIRPVAPCILIFLLTSYLAFLKREGIDKVLTLLNVIFLVLALLAIFGLDRVMWGSLCWLPLTLWVVQQAIYSKQKGIWVILTLAVGCRIALSANQLSPLVSLVACIAAFNSVRDAGDETLLRNSRFLSLLGVLLVLPALYTASVAPLPTVPHYPAGAHLVPFTGVSGFARPLFASGPELPIINREAVQTLCGIPSLILFLVALPLALISRSRVLVLAATLFGVTLFDSMLPETYAQIGPLSSLERLGPGWFFIPLAPLALALGTFFFFTSRAGKGAPALSVVGGLLILLQLSGGDDARPRDLPDEMDLVHFPELVSPSWYVFEHSYFTALDRRTADAARTREIRLTADAIRVTTNPPFQDDITPLLTDNKPLTRWTSARGEQRGDEWMKVEFNTPVTVNGIELSMGRYRPDFPRGIEIRGGATCDGGTLAVYPDWQGPILYTNRGYPYFGAQSDVRVLFRKEETISCLLIKQIARETHFEWSVAEIHLLKIDTPSEL